MSRLRAAWRQGKGLGEPQKVEKPYVEPETELLECEDGNQRRKLTEEWRRKVYNVWVKNVRMSFKKTLGNEKIRPALAQTLRKNGHNVYYEILGDCYLHGMMDGEAMAVQNGRHEDEDWIPPTVFEIR